MTIVPDFSDLVDTSRASTRSTGTEANFHKISHVQTIFRPTFLLHESVHIGPRFIKLRTIVKKTSLRDFKPLDFTVKALAGLKISK
jgi:hypothetical protein